MMYHVPVENFNPRAPCGARPKRSIFHTRTQSFQPTRPLRGATLFSRKDALRMQVISTHAPLAGRDAGRLVQTHNLAKFQPTRPLRGATSAGC